MLLRVATSNGQIIIVQLSKEFFAYFFIQFFDFTLNFICIFIVPRKLGLRLTALEFVQKGRRTFLARTKLLWLSQVLFVPGKKRQQRASDAKQVTDTPPATQSILSNSVEEPTKLGSPAGDSFQKPSSDHTTLKQPSYVLCMPQTQHVDEKRRFFFRFGQ